MPGIYYRFALMEPDKIELIIESILFRILKNRLDLCADSPIRERGIIMKEEMLTIPLERNPSISVNMIPGHYATSHSHRTHYLAVNHLKTSALLAREVARELASPYLSMFPVDTIVCMEETEVIGAYLAAELLKPGLSAKNVGRDIKVVTPILNINKKLTFQTDTLKQINNRNIILLLSSVTGGSTLRAALEALSYYRGKLQGISALFTAYPDQQEQKINSLFTSENLPGYKLYTPAQCPLCKAGQKIDAIIIRDGYMEANY